MWLKYSSKIISLQVSFTFLYTWHFNIAVFHVRLQYKHGEFYIKEGKLEQSEKQILFLLFFVSAYLNTKLVIL